MNNLQVLGKFLDQPMLVSKFQKAVPALLIGGAAAYTAYDASKAEEGQRCKRALKTGVTLGTTVAAALSAPHIASAITKRMLPEGLNAIKLKNKELVDTFVKSTPLEEKTVEENPDLINLKENGEFLSTDSAKILLRIARKDCGIHFKYHNLRHTHASWLAEHGVPAIVTKKRLGHSKEETTLRYYNHITKCMRNDLLDKLNKADADKEVSK